MSDWRLVVGLGNPGGEYARTRHNAGFMLADRLAVRWRAGWRQEARFQAHLAEGAEAGVRCLLCKPQTYMNASGTAVAAVAAYYRIEPGSVLVLVDDADLPLGGLRLRAEGGNAGHHGLESIESHLGSRAYARLRLGIGRRPEAGRQITGHVLGRFGDDETETLGRVLDRAVEQTCCWLAEGPLAAMNKFNGVVDDPTKKDS
jgi:PTH1 family peptidyl-tRNA hydrolase